MPFRLLTLLISLISLAGVAFSADQTSTHEITSVVGEVVINGSLKTDSRAKKELETLAKRLAKLPKNKMVEIEGAYPSNRPAEKGDSSLGSEREEYFRKSFFLAMEVESYIRETLGVNKDYYLSARGQNELKSVKPFIRIVLHTGTFEKQPIAAEFTAPEAQPRASSITQTSQPVPARPQVSPAVSLQNIGQQTGQYQPIEPAVDSSPIDERLVAEQARRATTLIEQTKIKAAERERKRKEEEKAANKDMPTADKAE